MHQSQLNSIPVNNFSHWQSTWACGTPAFDSPAWPRELIFRWHTYTGETQSGCLDPIQTHIYKDTWMQKLLRFSKAHTSYSKSFIKHTAKLNSLAACNGEAAISPFISVWAYSVHRLLYGKGPGWLALGEKKGRSMVNRRNLVKRR